ncbi:carboxypeptidase regulatory-like domain-containing protein [Aggregicoccus sp. 17bor-14]|uniref:carboxypeptidase-like regulatory domain-containing protein n=1 Tax=Myxococcaceae TaxID=31 RepID=UPI00129C1D40|nr:MULTISPECIES: carboxypeptidase-like regulatory domain-containing protein [Myxococcaceae]MBF5041866.1 Ig-like domain-containing protein [Simulacricoccus sp. 17bor-14]MRI87647.1 carboxypeptidase regulatory-like domain-containing protein [Aggregicoccus sp. 17bor-14]
MHPTKHPRSSLLLLCAGLAACGGSGTSRPSDAGSDGLEASVVKGRVTDAQGQPLPNIGVFAEAFTPIPQTGTAVTGADGRYRIALNRAQPGVFSVSAQRHFSYRGQGLDISFEPLDASEFTQNEGAVRDFVWPGLGGKRGSGAATMGTLFIDGRLSSVWEPERVLVTLEPLTPLLDGSSGSTLVAPPVNGPEGVGVYEVPYARYRVSARYDDPERGIVPMCVRAQGDTTHPRGALQAEADFRPVYSILTLELELGVPDVDQHCG